MKEIKDVASSILVLIVTAYVDEEVEVDAFRSGARNYLKKPSRKNILPGPDSPELPGTQPSTVTLNQYLKILQTVRFIKTTTEPISA
jgi:response regulator RpfG family c-di-GMP phosphodiesterase